MPRGKPNPKKSDDPVASLRKRIADAEKANAARIVERVSLSESDLAAVAELVEQSRERKADILRKALSLGIAQMKPTRQVWHDADSVNATYEPFVQAPVMQPGVYDLRPILSRGESGGDRPSLLDTMPSPPIEETGIEAQEPEYALPANATFDP